MARYLKECQYCGDTFQAARRDARYCQATCRAKASRSRKNKHIAPQPIENGVTVSALMQMIERQNELIQSLMQTIEHLQKPANMQSVQSGHQPLQGLQPLPGGVGFGKRFETEPMPEIKVKRSENDGSESSANFLNSLMALQG